MADYELTQEQLGQEQSYPRTQTINAAAEAIVSYAQKRKSIYIKNTSTGGQTISVVFSNETPATAGIGFVLGVNESLIDSDSEGYKCWSGKIRAISSAIGGTIAIFER